MEQKEILEKLQEFIRAHRSNEIHFEVLNHKLEETYAWAKGADSKNPLVQELDEIREKQAKLYKQSREDASSDWPQFEKFIQAFERSVTSALKTSQ